MQMDNLNVFEIQSQMFLRKNFFYLIKLTDHIQLPLGFNAPL
jgi:hypothetical protein